MPFTTETANYSVADLNWQSSGGGINFLLVPSSSPIFIRGHVNGSNFETTFAEEAQAPRTSSIGGFDLGFDFSYFLKNEGEMNYGFNNDSIQDIQTTIWHKELLKMKTLLLKLGYYNYRRVGKDGSTNWYENQAYASLNTISPEPKRSKIQRK